MRRGWQVGQLGGVPFHVHPGALLFVLLVAWLLATTFFPFRFPMLLPGARWGVALLTSLLFAASVIAHEFGHVWVARRRGMRAEGVALFHFGAVAWFEDDPPRASDEGWVALAGPASNLLIALLMIGLWVALGQPTVLPLRLAAEVSLFLAQMNLTLLLFNLLPIYPLDGGRAVHGLMWAITGDSARGMRATAYLSQGLALILFLGGVWLALRYQQGLLLFGSVALSWFLYRGSKVALKRLTARQRLGDWQVAQLMWRESPLLHPSQTLQEASVLMTLRGESVLPVVMEGAFVGLLTQADLQPISHQARAGRLVASAMRAAADLPSLTPEDRVDVALRRMQRAKLTALPVLEVGQLVGVLRQYDLARALSTNLAARPYYPSDDTS